MLGLKRGFGELASLLFWGVWGPGEGAGTGQLVGGRVGVRGVWFEGGGFWDVASLGRVFGCSISLGWADWVWEIKSLGEYFLAGIGREHLRIELLRLSMTYSNRFSAKILSRESVPNSSKYP